MKTKILYLIQAWSHAFRNEPKYKVIQDTYQIMKVEGKALHRFVNMKYITQFNSKNTWFIFKCQKKISCETLKRKTIASIRSGHVFPEFKESDAMFAAERVRITV